MARMCSICEKAKMSGHKVSHSNIKTNRVWNTNVQKVRVVNENGGIESKYVCTRCLKSDKVQRA